MAFINGNILTASNKLRRRKTSYRRAFCNRAWVWELYIVLISQHKIMWKESFRQFKNLLCQLLLRHPLLSLVIGLNSDYARTKRCHRKSSSRFCSGAGSLEKQSFVYVTKELERTDGVHFPRENQTGCVVRDWIPVLTIRIRNLFGSGWIEKKRNL